MERRGLVYGCNVLIIIEVGRCFVYYMGIVLVVLFSFFGRGVILIENGI